VNLVEKFAAEGRLTEEQVERIGRNVSAFLSQCDRDPSFKKEAEEKLGWRNLVKEVASKPDAGFFERAYAQAHDMAPLLAGSVGLGVLLGGVTDAGRKVLDLVKEKATKASSYKAMVEKNPQLANADPTMVEDAFSTLYRFNPSYAEDPLVAGTFVKNVLDQERVDIGTISNLVGARKQITDARRGSGSSRDFFLSKIPLGSVPGASGKDAAGPNAVSNYNVLAAQKSLEAAEEAYKAEQAKRQFWESAEPKYPDDPRVK
jgi:hypothetical protein